VLLFVDGCCFDCIGCMCVGVPLNVLQCVAVSLDVLQCVGVCCGCRGVLMCRCVIVCVGAGVPVRRSVLICFGMGVCW